MTYHTLLSYFQTDGEQHDRATGLLRDRADHKERVVLESKREHRKRLDVSLGSMKVF